MLIGTPVETTGGDDLEGKVKALEHLRSGYELTLPEDPTERQYAMGLVEGLRIAISKLRVGTSIEDPTPAAKRARVKQSFKEFAEKVGVPPTSMQRTADS